MTNEVRMESFNQNVIKHKTGLLNLAAELGNISKACRIMEDRDTFTGIRLPVMQAGRKRSLRSATESHT